MGHFAESLPILNERPIIVAFLYIKDINGVLPLPDPSIIRWHELLFRLLPFMTARKAFLLRMLMVPAPFLIR